jgi:hypothetical protein
MEPPAPKPITPRAQPAACLDARQIVVGLRSCGADPMADADGTGKYQGSDILISTGFLPCGLERKRDRFRVVF